MPKQSGRFARIAITLPRELLSAADRRARELDRSRSGVIADAVRRATSIPEPPAPASSSGLGESRRAQLAADLRLTPEARVREAELTERAVPARRTGRDTIVSFERYDDYLDWKRRQDVDG
jgi:hypothetical protein